MTEQEIQAFEKELKSVPLRPLSGAFFAAVEKELAAENANSAFSPEDALPEDLAEIEAALIRLRPRAPSAEFFERVAVAMQEENSDNALPFPQKPETRASKFSIAFPRWISAAAAVAVCAFGMYLWKAPDALESRLDDYAPHYELVSTENELHNIEELPLEVQEDGSLIQPLRYIYTNTKRWRDPASEKTFTECVPFEKIVSTAVAVY